MKFQAAITLSIITVIISGCRKPTPPPVEKTWLTMGTFASVTLRSDDAEKIERYHTEAARCFDEINQTLSVYRPDSEITQLNNATGMISVSEQTFQMLEKTIHYSKISGGAFDPTLFPLIRLWGFSGGTTPTNLPEVEAISKLRSNTGYQHMKLNPVSHTAGFDQPGMSIDLGGIAKGFAVDLAYDHLTSSLPANTLINLGGNIRCHGMATPDRPWRIGVRHPFDTSKTLGALSIASGMSLATSGNYERFVYIKEKSYAHIIDPRTGYPVKGMAGVTVLSTTAIEADAMSTALFVAGVENAPALLAECPNTQALLVPDKNPIEIWVSEGFQTVFTPHPEYADSVHLLDPYIEL